MLSPGESSDAVPQCEHVVNGSFEVATASIHKTTTAKKPLFIMGTDEAINGRSQLAKGRIVEWTQRERDQKPRDCEISDMFYI